jgi:ferrous iron transport protein B
VVSAILWLLSNYGPAPQSIVAPAAMDESFAAQLGRKIEPALRPMGVDWRVGVGLISAFAAREVFVSSMAIVFHVNGDDATRQEGLLEQMRTATFPGTSQRIFTPSSIVGLIVFFFFSLQCFSTVAVVRKETGSSRLAAAQLAFYTGLGYVLAVACVQLLRAFGVA